MQGTRFLKEHIFCVTVQLLNLVLLCQYLVTKQRN